ncbi:MAG TPA: hypothetical protein VGS98_12175, partial [Thermoanaerobaculia bacterium]|nr:hypothetical protein [Thermoanaerobaculia bacterium]
FRGGWGTVAAGIPDQLDTYYFGAAGGGVWKTEDAGRTWTSLFDKASASSVGALAIAPSDPNVIYVGTGQPQPRYDVISGDGVFRSDDGGRTWTRRGLKATRHIGAILVDPRDANTVLVGALGHIFGPNRERGVFRSTDGGRTWTPALFVNEDTGVVDLARDPGEPDVVYAAAWQLRNFPWLSYFKPNVGPGSAVYKSTDSGRTWKRLTGGGWPTGNVGRIGLAVSPGGRVWAIVDAQAALASLDPTRATSSPAGLYRSDDGGAAWTQVNATPGLASYYMGRVTPDPKNRDVLYVMGQSIRRSADGGKTFRIVKGAPGGDDYHFLWINPKRPDHMVTSADQGTVVTVNGGRTWSDWYNQPTGQFYHVETDDRFPYWIYSGQQDSGSVGTMSRSDFGGLTFRDWYPVGAEERGWDVPDPADPDVVYGTGLGGNVMRFDRRTKQAVNISPVVESTYARRPTEVKYRYTWITPLAVSKKPPHPIYYASQVLFRSTDRGQSWTVVSPDLTGAKPGMPGCDGEITLANASPCGFGVIFTIALSPRDENEIWVGTDDGRIQMTRDAGKTWNDVTPKDLAPWSKVSAIDVSALEPGTAYAAVDTHRKDDFAPHLFRTHDLGKTWTVIGSGIPATQYTSVVRADPVRKGLLYAGTIGGVHVSFDDGDHWQPLQLNLPTAWVGDLQVRGADLVAATNGRALWVLDDVAPLRQLTPAVGGEAVHLFEPGTAIRVRRNENRDTPLPPETPMGQNPPPGAVIDYTLASDVSGPVVIEVADARGRAVRKYSSTDQPEVLPATRYFAEEWLKAAASLPTTAGHHRVVWDLRGPRPKAERYNYSIAAIHGEDTPAEPEGPLAPPGRYTVRLTAGGKTSTHPLTLKLDPRVKTPEADIVKQVELASATAEQLDRTAATLGEVRALRKEVETARERAASSTAAAQAIQAFGERVAAQEKDLARLSGRFSGLFSALSSGDAAPTAQALAESEELRGALDKRVAEWNAIRTVELSALNEQLRAAGVPPIGLKR